MNRIIRSLSLFPALSLASCIVAPLPFTSDKSPQFKGPLVDARSGKPIAGAEMWAKGNERRKATSDEAGNFLLEPAKNFHLAVYLNPSFGTGFPLGTRTKVLMVEAEGYKPLALDFASEVVRKRHVEAES